MARNGVLSTVKFFDDPRLMRHLRSLLVLLPPAVREDVLEIEVFAVFLESDYDADLEVFAFLRTREVLWLSDISVRWFLYSRDTVEVSNVPIFGCVTNKRTISGACLVGEEHDDDRAFLHAG